MICSCCLTTLEVKYVETLDETLCPQCEAEAHDAIDGPDDSDVLGAEWEEWEDGLVFDESDEEALEAIYDALENAEYEAVYAEDHDYGN